MIWWILACSSPEPEVVPTPPSPPTVVVGVDTIGDAPPIEPAGSSRVRRRMQIHQLDAAIRVATGGIGWDNNRGDSEFDALSASLGVPDYQDRTEPDLNPGLLFQKFLGDAANAVCHDLIEGEADGTSSVFLTQAAVDDTPASNPTGVDATLADALLRFHGHRVQPDDPQIEGWRTLLQETIDVTGGDAQAGWRAVCIGLITHPDFYEY